MPLKNLAAKLFWRDNPTMEPIERAALVFAVFVSWFVLAVVLATKQPLPVILPAIVLAISLPLVWLYNRPSA